MRKFERLRHVRYFSTCLRNLPKQYSSADTNRLTLVHFCVQALDILGCLPDGADVCGQVEKDVCIPREGIVEWIYGLQTLPTFDDDGSSDGSGSSSCVGGGFKGGTYLGPLPNASATDGDEEEQQPSHPYDHSHLAMTYVALCTLAALGDDLSRVNKAAILSTLQSLQKEDGSFVAISSNCSNDSTAKEDDDCDLRFVYTAIAIWYLLTGGDDATINIQSATSYILSCISYDGALGLTPGREGHGGSTFCGIASLCLLGVMDEVMARDDLRGWRDDLIRWCVSRQHSLPKSTAGLEHNGFCDADTTAGMQGRPNKAQDTCYSYWIGGTLHLLGEAHLLDGWALREYVLTCQSPYGGFGKVVNAMPDLLHSFYSLAWLALSKEQGCCEEDGEADEDEGEGVGYDSEVRQQVCESIDQLSRLDCAMGMCVKRKPAFQRLTGR